MRTAKNRSNDHTRRCKRQDRTAKKTGQGKGKAKEQEQGKDKKLVQSRIRIWKISEHRAEKGNFLFSSE